MLCDFVYTYDPDGACWRSPKSLGKTGYNHTAPLFSNFRLAAQAPNVRLSATGLDPGLTDFARHLAERASITTVHLPLVPQDVDDMTAWRSVVTLPQHQQVIEAKNVRQWLHYLAHTVVEDNQVRLPRDLATLPVFQLSAAQAQDVLGSKSLSYSEKEMVDFALQMEREKNDLKQQTILQSAQRLVEAGKFSTVEEACAVLEHAT
jgi:hypothetical protein